MDLVLNLRKIKYLIMMIKFIFRYQKNSSRIWDAAIIKIHATTNVIIFFLRICFRVVKC